MISEKQRIKLLPRYFFNCDESNLLSAKLTKDMLSQIIDTVKDNRGSFVSGEEAIDFCLNLLDADYC